MKILKKVIPLIIMTLFIFNINCYATDLTCGGIEDSSKIFLQKGGKAAQEVIGKAGGTETITMPIVVVSRILMVIGVLVVGICMVILGIQWVLSKPSPEAQAKLKTRFVALAISAAVIFGSYTIWSIVVQIMTKID